MSAREMEQGSGTGKERCGDNYTTFIAIVEDLKILLDQDTSKKHAKLQKSKEKEDGIHLYICYMKFARVRRSSPSLFPGFRA
jgi:hypothetical protein